VRRLAQLALALGLFLALVTAFGVALFQALILRDLPALYSLTDYRPNLITEIESADGRVYARFYKERRELVPIERIPSHVVYAFVAAEDESFYEHEGLDYTSILRAAWANLRAGGIRQGGSTITQQVAKTFLLSSERSYLRKLKDMVLAMRIEKHLNKNEILYLYLNQIYLGSGAYGVQSAAHTYFGRPVEELTLAQAALIAGVVPAPSRYSPFRSMELARTRQRFVLGRMVEAGFVTGEEERAALAEPISLAAQQPEELEPSTAYFAEEVRRWLVERYGAERVLTGGLRVRTTLDLDHQREAYAALRRGLEAHDHRQGWRGALRSVPAGEWPALEKELAGTNGAGPWADGAVLRGLVTKVDDARGQLRLALGGGRETALTLDDVSWARTPNPEVDGQGYRIDRVGRAFAPGQLVELTKTGEFEAADEHPAARLAPAGAPRPRFALYQSPASEGALLSMEIPSGQVRALVGGYSFAHSQFNRAVQSLRQPGSSFKPIVYAAALEHGYTPASIVYDTPIVYEDPSTGVLWKPGNYSDEFLGPITLRKALAQSRNVATIRLMQDVGIPAVVRMARAVGITSPLEETMSMALGASEVTVAEMVRAYGTFASGGRRIEPVFVLEVRERDGTLLDRHVPLLWSGAAAAAPPPVDEPNGDERLAPPGALDADLPLGELANGVPGPPAGYAVDPVTAFLITDLMQAVVQEGTGSRAKALNRPVAGKTGTTNDLYDAWFIGYTPSLVAAVWVGYDDVRTLGKNESGSRAASPIFVDYMGHALAGAPRQEFRAPAGVVFARIDRSSGLLAASGDDYVFQAFREGTAPSEFAGATELSGGPPVRLD
jgi:penicillin-binding protein 1A